jgi:peptidoglycan-associated lipoprotein
MKKLLAKLALIAAAVSFLAGCPSTPLTRPTDTGKVVTPDSTMKSLDPLKDPANVLSKRSVYFDLDSNTVKDEFRTMLQAHAKYLIENPKRKIRIEGNTDERGTREYNLALGSRRGDAVKKVLNVLGVAESRIETVSFGKEKPKATGSDEASWAENRRADIVYDGE